MTISGLFSLDGKTAVVTGANRGLGFAMAEALAQAGANIIGVSANIDLQNSEIGRRVTALGRSFEAIQCDFDQEVQVEQVAQELAQRDVDVLVNNAGTIERYPAADHPLESWDRVLRINLSSQFRFTQPIAKKMINRGRGKIIFTASLLSFQGGINVPSYTASKSAISGLVKALSNEWAKSGVSVNAIAPGYFVTDNTEALRRDANRSQAILDRIPAARWGEPSDLAGATVFLASQGSDYVSGVTLPVDGGWLGR